MFFPDFLLILFRAFWIRWLNILLLFDFIISIFFSLCSSMPWHYAYEISFLIYHTFTQVSIWYGQCSNCRTILWQIKLVYHSWENIMTHQTCCLAETCKDLNGSMWETVDLFWKGMASANSRTWQEKGPMCTYHRNLGVMMLRALIISFVVNALPRVRWRNTGFCVCVCGREVFYVLPLWGAGRESRL
jgi:hypothetical protein